MNILRHFKPKTAFLCLILFALVSVLVLNTVVNDKIGFLQDLSFNEEDLNDPVLNQFAPVWTEREMDTTVALLEFFDEVAARKQIDYFIFDSTLWGAINMKSFVPWDKTVTIAMEDSTDLTSLSLLLSPKSVTLASDPVSPNTFVLKKNDIQIIIKLFGVSSMTNMATIDNIEIPYSNLFPTIRSSIYNGFMVKSPQSPYSVLNIIYNSKYKNSNNNNNNSKDRICYLGRNRMEINTNCEKLRMKYKYKYVENKGENKIPKIIHQVWIGDTKLPPIEAMETCKEKHKGWEYKIWNEDNLPIIEAKEAYNKMTWYNGKADIIRWQLLKTYGGVWIDADTYCLRSIDDLLQHNNDFFTGYHHQMNPDVNYKIEKNNGLIANSVVGSIPNHPMVVDMVDTLIRNPDLVLKEKPWKTVGPVYLTNFIKKYGKVTNNNNNNNNNKINNIGVYPFYYFVPYHWTEVDKKEGGKITEELIRKQEKYKSYAVNTWGTTFKTYDLTSLNNKNNKYELFIAILTHESYIERRNALRETWLTSIPKFKGNVGYAFFMGKPTTSDVKYQIEQEINKYNDIIIIPDLIDNFSNLSMKVIEIITWTVTNINTDLLLKTDDDSFVDVDHLLQTIPTNRNKLYMGYMWENTQFNHVKESKWYDPFFFNEPFWRNCTFYPKYASGAGYILSFDLLQWIHRSRPLLRTFHNEDSMIGIWMTILNVDKIHNPLIHPIYDKKRKCPDQGKFILYHNIPDTNIMRYWWRNKKEIGKFC